MNLFKLSRTAMVAGLVVTGALFSTASAVAAPASAFATHKDIAITVRESASFWDTVGMLAQGIGTVTHRDPQGNVVIRLYKGISYEEALERLEGRANVLKAEPIAPQAPIFLQIRSVKGLRNAIEEYRETYAEYREAIGWEEDDKEGKEEGEEGDETPGLDYIESYLQYMEIRAYPADDWDGSAYYDWARNYIAQQNNKYEGFIGENRERQQRLTGPGFNPNFQGAAAPNWTYIGGTDINAPYRIYFGLSPVNGRINAVAFHPTNPNTFIAGGAEGGVWRTTDAGVNWTPLGDAWPTMGVNALAYKPNDPNVILVGTGDLNGGAKPGIGIMRSADGGNTWTATGTALLGSRRIRRISFDPDNNNIVYATSATGNVVRSTDGGLTWNTAFSNNQRWTELAVGAPRSGGRNIWAGAGGSGSTPVLFRSQDQGATWTAITLPGTGTGNIGVAASPVNPDTVYVMRTGDRQIYKSINAGVTWTNTTTSFPNGNSSLGATYNWSQSWYDWYLRCSSRPTASGNEDVLYAGLIDIVQSVDGGASWRSIGGGKNSSGVWQAAYTGSAIVHQDNHDVAVDPNNPNRILVGTDGGVYLLTFNDGNNTTQTDDTITYGNLNRRLGVTQFYRISQHPTNRNYVMGGTQDNSTPHSFGNIADWANIGAGDGSGNAINPFNINQQYDSSQGQNIYATTNAYGSKTTIANGGSTFTGQSSIPFIGLLRLDPNNGQYLYANTSSLNRFNRATGTWTLQLGGRALDTNSINSIAIAPGNSNRILVGGDGRIEMSTDFGVSFARIDRQGQANGLPNRVVTEIAFHPTNQQDVVVTLSSSGTQHVYRCTNIDAATPVWTPVGNGLPDIPANSIVRHPDDPNNTWYVAMDVGVWMTKNGGATWTDITTPRGLPRVRVDELVINGVTRQLTAGTFGRGMWQLEIEPYILNTLSAVPNPVVGGNTSVATLTLKRPAPTGGLVVNLTDNSPLITVPATVTVAAGATSATFNVTTTSDVSDYSGTITAEYLGDEIQMNLNVLGEPLLIPATATLTNFSNVGGTLNDLRVSDDVRYGLRVVSFESGLPTAVFSYVAPTGSISSLTYRYEFRSDVRKVPCVVHVWNWNTNAWELLFAAPSAVTDSVRTGTLNVANHMNASTREIRMRVSSPREVPQLPRPFLYLDTATIQVIR